MNTSVDSAFSWNGDSSWKSVDLVAEVKNSFDGSSLSPSDNESIG